MQQWLVSIMWQLNKRHMALSIKAIIKAIKAITNCNLQYTTVHYSTSHYITIQHSTTKYSTVQHSTAQRITVQYNNGLSVLCSNVICIRLFWLSTQSSRQSKQSAMAIDNTPQHITVHHIILQFSTSQHSTVQYSTVQHSTSQCNTAMVGQYSVATW